MLWENAPAPGDCTTDSDGPALLRWDIEDGAVAAKAREVQPDMTNTELVLLRVRVIALENVSIAVLAEGSYARKLVMA